MLQQYPVQSLQNLAPLPGAPVFSIRLIDRRTGEVPRVNGNPVSFLTSAPRLAVEELLKGRDREKWTAEVDRLSVDGKPVTAGLGAGNR